MTPESVADSLAFEESESMSTARRVTLRFAKKVAFGEQMQAEDYGALRAEGFQDADIVELISVALVETALARRSLAISGFDDADDWPEEHLPSANYL